MQCVNEVVATIRIGSYEEPLESLESVTGDGACPNIVTSFHELMKRFVCCGPGSARRIGSSDKGIVVKTLTVNSASDDEPDSNSKRLERACTSFIDILVRYFESGFRSAVYHRNHRAVVMYERIGRLRGCLNGRRLVEQELHDPLTEFRPRPRDNDARDWYLEDFVERKREALRRRREAGLDPDV